MMANPFIAVYLCCVLLLYPSNRHQLTRASLFMHNQSSSSCETEDMLPNLRLYTITELNDFFSGSQTRIGCHNDTQFTYFCEGYGSVKVLTWSFMTLNSTTHQSDSYKDIKSYFVMNDTWNMNNAAFLREITEKPGHYRVIAMLIQDINDKQSCQNPKLASTLTVQPLFSDIKFSIKCTIDGQKTSINQTVHHLGLTIGGPPAEPQDLRLKVLFCYHMKQISNATVTVEWSPPMNEELVPLLHYNVTIFENSQRDTLSSNAIIRAKPGQNITHTYTAVFSVSTEGSTYNASIFAESECGVKGVKATVPHDQEVMKCSACINKLCFMSVFLYLFIPLFVNT